MHELGYASQLVDTLKDFMADNDVHIIRSVTLKVGEATAIVPRFMLECWPAVIENEPGLSECELKVEVVGAIGRCHNCETEYLISQNEGHCPNCHSPDYDFVTGYEFEVSEIRGS